MLAFWSTYLLNLLVTFHLEYGLFGQNWVPFWSAIVAAESKKGFLPVVDKKAGYSFLYPFGWQEVAVQGQDKVYKDVIEPLESVSVNSIPTSKEDIRDLGPPDKVNFTISLTFFLKKNIKTGLVRLVEVHFDLL